MDAKQEIAVLKALAYIYRRILALAPLGDQLDQGPQKIKGIFIRKTQPPNCISRKINSIPEKLFRNESYSKYYLNKNI